MIQELNDQEIIRRNKLAELRELGIEPYPAEEYIVNHRSNEILADYETDKPGLMAFV